MELLEGIKARKSMRAFKPTPIPREVLEGVLEAAGNSPSFRNTQSWEVAVVTGKKRNELSEILYEMAKSGTTPNPDLPLLKTWPTEMEQRAAEHGAARLKAVGIERDNKQQREELRLQNYKFYGAPCALFLFIDSTLASWSILDMGLFTQGVGLAAHSFGLGSCLQASIVCYPDAVRKCLGIPKSKLLVLGMSVGYPDMDAPINKYRCEKISLKEFVRWYE